MIEQMTKKTWRYMALLMIATLVPMGACADTVTSTFDGMMYHGVIHAKETTNALELNWAGADASHQTGWTSFSGKLESRYKITGEVTDIEAVASEPSAIRKTEEWYTLDGRRINAKFAAKGVYIHQGKKVVVK